MGSSSSVARYEAFRGALRELGYVEGKNGHAKQAGLGVLSCSVSGRNGRYVVVVDDDIDPTNQKEVLSAMTTRVDPATNIDIIEGCWSTP